MQPQGRKTLSHRLRGAFPNISLILICSSGEPVPGFRKARRLRMHIHNLFWVDATEDALLQRQEISSKSRAILAGTSSRICHYWVGYRNQGPITA